MQVTMLEFEQKRKGKKKKRRKNKDPITSECEQKLGKLYRLPSIKISFATNPTP